MNTKVAQQPFDRIFANIAIPAMQLQRLVTDLEPDIGSKTFCHGTELRCIIGLVIKLPCSLVQHKARCFELGYHIRELELQRLKLIKAFAKLLADFHVIARMFHCSTGAANRTGRNIQPPAIQPLHGKFETFTLFAQTVFDRHLAIAEDNGGCRLTVPAHFFFELAK